MPDTRATMLVLVAFIKYVVTHRFLAPFQGMIEKEFMTRMEDFAMQEIGRVCELPVSPERKMDAEKINSLCLLLESGNVPWMYGRTKLNDLLESMSASAWWVRKGVAKLRHRGSGDRGSVLGHASNKLLLGEIGDISNERGKAIPYIAKGVCHRRATFCSLLQ